MERTEQRIREIVREEIQAALEERAARKTAHFFGHSDSSGNIIRSTNQSRCDNQGQNQLAKFKATTEAFEQRLSLLVSACGGKAKVEEISTSIIRLLNENNITPGVAHDLLEFIGEIYVLEQRFPQLTLQTAVPPVPRDSYEIGS
jgi:hypothetical protein